ncbi:2-hydroxyacid dehydrogenase [Brevibacterium luteolum]|uniref:2-hydroxyacid dehydrogenase n=1 Tax=Brevibacterium luteolum TaxID=199591 RepID=UPI00223B8BF3|nr:2-hydroxyacid dehydrogenase [Brevibacterium luteolum]MCT1874715.1 2-hydroxyacid dehydrogenase [Brevibacterium luteolum]MCT1891839.1 2-hydroxyacid dehydrogenase [Brevibacterium luteolum]MCT1894408.1 2-hydroxyacid dehydrogenase [Brevibacterium luteolum]MCT1925278.1 2-hydroxyacid dehydrogenase [Brevibacterium luteolum]
MSTQDAMSAQSIRTIAFPDSDLRNRVIARIPAHQRANVDLVVYSAEEKSDKTSPDDVDVLILPYTDAEPTIEMIPQLENLKTVLLQTTGYDPVAHLTGDYTIATASGVHTGGTAELAVALVLAKLRGIDAAARDMVSRTWNHRRRRSLQDRRVLVVGVGEIGDAIAARLEPFDVELTRVASRARTDDRGQVHGPDELPKLLPHAEVVILITPLTEATHHLVDAAFLAQLPDNALVVNVARGPVVDTDALVEELRSGRLQAALDVVDPEPLPENHPLWGTPNTLLTPHIGGDTTAFEPRIVQMLTEQVRRINDGQQPLNIVS